MNKLELLKNIPAWEEPYKFVEIHIESGRVIQWRNTGVVANSRDGCILSKSQWQEANNTTPEIDWDSAPEGATHYLQGHMSIWWRFENEKYYYLNNGGWVKSTEEYKVYDRLIRCPDQHYIPLVGEECEYKINSLSWKRAKILYSGNIIILYLDESDVENCCDLYDSRGNKHIPFRPIQTKKDKELQAITDLQQHVAMFLEGPIGMVLLSAIQEGKITGVTWESGNE